MDVVLPYIRSVNQIASIADKQMLSGQFTSPFECGIEGVSGWIKMISPASYGMAINDCNSLEGLYNWTDYLDVTTSIRSDTEDSSVNETGFSANLSATKRCEEASGVNTKSEAINRENLAYLNYLRSRTDEISNAIIRTDFEDGMDNDVTLLFKKFVKWNKSATFNWINELYSKNMGNPVVVDGLLRTLAMITEKGDETILLPIVVASLRSEVSVEQESAIMVIEEWRTRECLEAIRRVRRFPSDIVADYANMVATELEEELGETDKRNR